MNRAAEIAVNTAPYIVMSAIIGYVLLGVSGAITAVAATIVWDRVLAKRRTGRWDGTFSDVRERQHQCPECGTEHIPEREGDKR